MSGVVNLSNSVLQKLWIGQELEPAWVFPPAAYTRGSEKGFSHAIKDLAKQGSIGDGP